MIFFVVLISIIKSQSLYNSSLYTLGDNLLFNGNFTYPIIPSGTSYTIYTGSIPGWVCDISCDVKNMAETCSSAGFPCDINFTKGVDFESSFKVNSLIQNVSINASGQALLQVEWLTSFNQPLEKNLTIYINSSLFAVEVVTLVDYKTHFNQYLIDVTQGTLSLKISQFGVYSARGIIVGSVSLQLLIPIASPSNVTNSSYTTTNISNNSSNYFTNSTNLTNSSGNYTNSTQYGMFDQVNQTINDQNKNEKPVQIFSTILLNEFTTSLNSLPGNRIYTSVLMNFLITFDRLQLYYFHRQNLTYYSTVFLSDINTLQIEKDGLPQQFFEACQSSSEFCLSVNNFYKNLLQSLNQKYEYSDSMFLQRNQSGIGFYANNLDFFVYKLPSLLLIYFLMQLIFRALFNYRLSLYFRKYSFYGILLLIIYEGNVEQFTFYFFQECKYLFSSSFYHKLATVFMVFFFFVTLVFSVGGLVYFKFHYKNLVKYFTEEYKVISIWLLGLQSLEKSIFPLIFGCIHAILLTNLLYQTVALGIVEIGYFLVKLVYLRTIPVMFKFKVVLLSLTSLLRMVFIATFYLYQVYERPEIINSIHYHIVWLYLICWMIETIHDVLTFLVDVISIIRKRYPQRHRMKNHKKVNLAKERDVVEAEKINCIPQLNIRIYHNKTAIKDKSSRETKVSKPKTYKKSKNWPQKLSNFYQNSTISKSHNKKSHLTVVFDKDNLDAKIVYTKPQNAFLKRIKSKRK